VKADADADAPDAAAAQLLGEDDRLRGGAGHRSGPSLAEQSVFT
jgi:hypothetical protein